MVKIGDIGKPLKHIELVPNVEPTRREVPAEPVVVPERELEPA